MRLSPALLLAWTIASTEAAGARWEEILPEHMVVGIFSLEKLDRSLCRQMGLKGQAIEQALEEMDDFFNWASTVGVNLTTFRRSIRNRLGDGGYSRQDGNLHEMLHRSSRTKEYFSKAGHKAISQGCEVLTVFYLLRAIAEEPTAKISQVASQEEQNLERWTECIRQKSSKEDNSLPVDDADYGRNLTSLAKEGRIGPFWGRDREIQKLIEALLRLVKHNVLILGEAGVGKTALAEQLSVMIANGKVPQSLKNKEIIEIQLGSIVAGTKYRGEFEARIQQIVKRSEENPNIILFIDEIHTLLGAGSAEGALDAANILKPSLARGRVRVIGATTIDEYYRSIAKDTALDRRFTKLVLQEPTEEETFRILSVQRIRYESAYDIIIPDGILRALIQLSQRFDLDNRLPDKVIDLLEQSCVRLYLQKAGGVRKDTLAPAELSIALVSELLAEKTKVPFEVIQGFIGLQAPEQIIRMADSIKKEIIGQDYVIEQVTNRLLVAHSAVSDKERPLAVFLFAGPSGTGKTEMAKQMQRFLFRDKESLIRLDMSEFSAEHHVARLIGSPPGYIGHGEEGQLTKALRRQPYSVVLFDEIEKAHPRIFDIFLQLFSEGRITDGMGRTISGKNNIFVMTSNLLIDNSKERVIGFERQEVSYPERYGAHRITLQRYFRMEFLNRIDDVLVFSSFSREDRILILKKLFKEWTSGIYSQYGLQLRIDDAVIDWLERETNHNEGTRGLKRALEENIETIVIQRIIRLEWSKGESHTCMLRRDKLCWE